MQGGKAMFVNSQTRSLNATEGDGTRRNEFRVMHSISSVQCKAFSEKLSVSSIRFQAFSVFSEKHSVSSIQCKAFGVKHSI